MSSKLLEAVEAIERLHGGLTTATRTGSVARSLADKMTEHLATIRAEAERMANDAAGLITEHSAGFGRDAEFLAQEFVESIRKGPIK